MPPKEKKRKKKRERKEKKERKKERAFLSNMRRTHSPLTQLMTFNIKNNSSFQRHLFYVV